MTTTGRWNAPGPAAPDRPSPSSAADRTRSAAPGPLVWIQVLIVTLVVFQRLVVPGVGVSVALPVEFVIVAALAARGHLRVDASRFLLYFLAVGSCVLVGVLAANLYELPLSINSLLLLVAVYAPYCLRVSPALRARYPEVLEFFQRLMVVLAVVCLLQLAAQLAGWSFRDVMSDVLPSSVLVSDSEFNYSYPIYYGASVYKSNGLVFLEASFASQFLALAIIVQILLGRIGWRLVLFGAALVSTLSGTGLVLLGAGLLVLAVRRGGMWAARATITVLVAVVAVALTPAGDLLADRAGETSTTGSSGNTRFVTPFVNVATAVARDQSALLIGHGAGSTVRDSEFFNPRGVPVNYTAVPKLVGEYGLPAALVFLAFLFTVFLRRVPSVTVGAVVCVQFFLLSGALLQPSMAYTCWVFTGLFGAAPAAAGHRPIPRRSS